MLDAYKSQNRMMRYTHAFVIMINHSGGTIILSAPEMAFYDEFAL